MAGAGASDAPQAGGTVRMGQQAVEMAGEKSLPTSYDSSGISLGDLMRGERATLGKSLLDVQRELKIKAAYIAAIENADAGAFETPGFIAGYLRSYARYLGLDPDRAFAAFCAESGFQPAHGISGGAAPGRRPSPSAPVTLSAERDIFADRAMPYAPPPQAILSRIEPGAVGSLAVLVALIGAVGWGGWTVLQEMQRVTLEPVADASDAVAGIDPLASAEDVLAQAGTAEPERPEPDALNRLYRPRALDVPVLVARDGPIASLDPGAAGALAGLDARGAEAEPPRFLSEPQAGAAPAETAIDGAVMAALSDLEAPAVAGRPAEPGTEAVTPEAVAPEGEGTGEEPPQVVAAAGDRVVLVAVRPSWVRVRAADGTVVLEKILETGETYPVERTEAPATLRTGNAGAVYFAVGGQTFGPAGEGPTVVSDIALSPEAVADGFAVADLSADPELERMVRVASASPEAAAAVVAPMVAAPASAPVAAPVASGPAAATEPAVPAAPAEPVAD